MRFTETPFDNPFRTAQAAPVRDPVTTGSIGSSSGSLQPVPSSPVVRSQSLPPPQASAAMRPAPVAPVAAAPSAQPVGGSAAGWTAQGGTPIVLAQGETLDMISSRYGVPRAALISANGLSNANVAPGTRLTIPIYNASGAATAAAEPVRRAASPTPESRGFVQGAAPVRQAATEVRSQARSAAEVKPVAEARTAAASKAEADAQAMKESRARFAAEAKAKAEARKATVAEAKPAAAPAQLRQPKVATTAVEPAKPVAVASAPATEKLAPAAKAEPAPEPKTTASLPKQEAATSSADKADFRWPARGRVISGFSGKGGNEGINIAVPDGTPVKAAEEGTVAYAGSELKGYGNLVLIRHPNGYVSAYAHNGELKVKRGDTVKRGQVVASSGQTGNVSSPQLHFELRKGSTPVDPTPYLNN